MLIRRCLAMALLSAVCVVPLASGESKEAEGGKPDPAAVKRTREQVKMLDDLYKSAIVHITKTYVKAKNEVPAATPAKKVFKDMAAHGWHKVRLIDTTGAPIHLENVAKTDFEKRAVEKIKKGKGYYEEVGTDKKGKPVLLAATVVPVVMKSCMNCHSGLKEGAVMGALTYEVPIK